MEPKLEPRKTVGQIAEIVSAGKSGVFTLRRGAAAVGICIRNGHMAFAKANLKSLQPEAWLAEQGIATASEVQAARGKRPGTRGLVETLLRDRGGDRAAIVEALRDLTRRIIRDSLAWTEGTCRFDAGNPVLDDEIVLDDDSAPILLFIAEGIDEQFREQLSGLLQVSARAPDLGAMEAVELTRPALDPAHEAVRRQPEAQAFLEHFRQAETQTFYELLGIEHSVAEDVIREAYYKLARTYHPDSLRSEAAEACRPEAEAYFAAVTEAYNTLTRPGQRKEYDENLAIGNITRSDVPVMDAAALARTNYLQGRKALSEDRLHDAAQFFSNAVEQDPERGEYHRELGIVQMRNPRWKKQAEESLQRAVTLSPTDGRAAAHLGMLYLRNGLKKRAEETFQAALTWDPTDETALEGMDRLRSSAEPAAGLLGGLLGRKRP